MSPWGGPVPAGPFSKNKRAGVAHVIVDDALIHGVGILLPCCLVCLQPLFGVLLERQIAFYHVAPFLLCGEVLHSLVFEIPAGFGAVERNVTLSSFWRKKCAVD